ncbi:hypothetical protein GCM10025857_31300 [Alicyclobacillus contaminans]|nr:hypothetical protein GCM10025857_31300 [Alicyclobacillus contaminans]
MTHTAGTPSTETLLDRARLALKDEFLRAAVRFTADRLRTKKQATTDEFGA